MTLTRQPQGTAMDCSAGCRRVDGCKNCPTDASVSDAAVLLSVNLRGRGHQAGGQASSRGQA